MDLLIPNPITKGDHEEAWAIFFPHNISRHHRLDNVTTMLLMAPMTLNIFKAVGKNPGPLLMAQVPMLVLMPPSPTVTGAALRVPAMMHSKLPPCLPLPAVVADPPLRPCNDNRP